VQFYAPNGHGLFEFRVYDGEISDDVELPEPVGSSPPFRVEVGCSAYVCRLRLNDVL
jgi:hypothetical protein